MVSKIGGQVVVWVTGGWHEISVLVEHRVPVVHVAAIKPIEIIEAEAIGPAVERTSGTGFPNGRVVVLPDPRCHVPVLPKDFPDRPSTAVQHSCVTVISANHSGSRRVMVAPGDERCACWAAKRRRVETVVAQALCRELVHRWREY